VSLLLIVPVVGAALVALGGAVAALRAKRNYRQANEILAGVDTGAPAEWAGAHNTEARLHRRLRDVVASLDRQRLDDAGLVDIRMAVEREAVAVDRHLVTVAALPPHLRGAALEEVSAAVAGIEEAVVTVVGWSAQGSGPGLSEAMAETAERLRLIAEARQALESPGPAAAPTPVPVSDPEPGGRSEDTPGRGDPLSG
jgi:hypothetical protein